MIHLFCSLNKAPNHRHILASLTYPRSQQMELRFCFNCSPSCVISESISVNNVSVYNIQTVHIDTHCIV